MNPQQSQYATQFLIKSTRHESLGNLFRRVQRVVRDWLLDEFYDTPEAREQAESDLAFELFQSKDGSLCASPIGKAQACYLETGKILSHAIHVEKRLKSDLASNGFDRVFVEDVCIESAKGDSIFPGIRFSYSSGLVYMPFLGFFNIPEKVSTVSELVKHILSMPDTDMEFCPCVRQKSQLEEIKFSYPLVDKPFRTDDDSSEIEFLDRLRDPYRPICLVVMMSDTDRAEKEASILARELQGNAHVWVLHHSKLLSQGFAKCIPGFDEKKNYSGTVCRVFFPFEQYSPMENHNPLYRFPWLGGSEYRALILRGVFQYYRIQLPGWRTTIGDIDYLKWKLNQERKKNLQESEEEEQKASATHLGKLLAISRDENKALHDELSFMEETQERLHGDIRDLHGEVGELTSEVSRLRMRKLADENDSPKEIRPLPTRLEEVLLWAKDFLTHLVILPNAMKTARQDNGQRDCGLAWDILRSMNSTLFDLRYGSRKNIDIKREFEQRTRFCYADESGETKNMPEVQKERRLVYEGRNVDFWLHIKPASCNKEAKLIRAYFAFDDDNRKILIGFFGPHLRNAATKHVH